jgi:dipeptidyl aminopeptidase/acylaminoacyl peptidase
MIRASATLRVAAIALAALALLGVGCATRSTTAPTSPTDLEPAVPTPEPPTPLPAEIPDIEQFMRILSASDPRRTPDGTVYYLTWATGVDQLYRLRPGAEASEQPLTDFEDGLETYSVSPDGATILLQSSVGGSEQADLYRLDPVSLEVTPLFVHPDFRYENVQWLRDSSGFFYRSNETNGIDFHVYRYDLASGTSTLIAAIPGFNWISDVADDGSRLLVTRYQSNADSDVYEYELDHSDGVRERHLTPHEGEVQYFSPTWDAMGRILVASNRDASLRGVGALVGDSGAVDYLVTGRWEVEDMVLSDDRRTLAYVTNEDGYGRVHLLDLTARAPLPGPVLPEGVATLGPFEHGHLLMVFSSATLTHDVWEHALEAGRTRQVTFSDYAGVDQSLFREPRLVRFQSFDGLEVPAFLYLPPNYEGGRVPTIIDVHGGPEAQFRPSFNRHFQYLMLNGFALLAPNIRGSSGYGPEYLALDNYERRLDAIRDLGAAADYLLAEGLTDESRLGIKGGSYGGYAVMAAITEMPERFAAASNEVGIVNFVSFLENTADYRRALREAEYGPLSDRAFLESISPIHKVDRIQAPLLVIHGENDTRVPVGEARQIIAALEAREHPVEALIFANEGHGVRHLENRLVMYRTMVDFFSRHLAGPRDGER